jgi:hypothetical protein
MPVGAGPIHRIWVLCLYDMAALRTAFASREGQDAAADRRLYAPDDSGVQMFFFDERDV